MVFQITGVSIVCSTVCSCADQRKHQHCASLAFVKGIHRRPMDRWPMDSPHKGPVTRKRFPFDDVVMVTIVCFYCQPHVYIQTPPKIAWYHSSYLGNRCFVESFFMYKLFIYILLSRHLKKNGWCYLAGSGLLFKLRFPLWRHDMATLYVLQIPCEGISPVTGGSPSQRASNTGFNVIIYANWNMLLKNQSICRNLGVTAPMWRHRTGLH